MCKSAPYIFTDGRLEHSAFEGGYFDADKGAMYYVTDWQGNNAAVVDKSGSTSYKARCTTPTASRQSNPQANATSSEAKSANTPAAATPTTSVQPKLQVPTLDINHSPIPNKLKLPTKDDLQ